MTTFLFSLLLIGAIVALASGVSLIVCAVKRYRRRPQDCTVTSVNTKKNKKHKHQQLQKGNIEVKTGSSYALPLAGGLLMSALGVYLMHAFCTIPRTDEQRAAAYMIGVLNSDASLRGNPVAGIDRGPQDVQPQPFNRCSEDLTGQQMRDAGRIITAVTEGDVSELQAIVTSYQGRPYALAQIALALHHLCDHMETKYVFYTHKKWLYVGSAKPKEGDFDIVFSVENEAPQVVRWTQGQEAGVPLTPQVAKDILPSTVLNRLQTDIVEKVLRKKALSEGTTSSARRF